MSLYKTQTDTSYQYATHPRTQKVSEFNEILRALNLPAISEDKLPTKQNMSKQQIALDQVRSGGYLVGSIDAGAAVSFSTYPRIHETPADARAECKRLAAQNPGKAFIFVKLAGAELIPQATAVSI